MPDELKSLEGKKIFEVYVYLLDNYGPIIHRLWSGSTIHENFGLSFHQKCYVALKMRQIPKTLLPLVDSHPVHSIPATHCHFNHCRT